VNYKILLGTKLALNLQINNSVNRSILNKITERYGPFFVRSFKKQKVLDLKLVFVPDKLNQNKEVTYKNIKGVHCFSRNDFQLSFDTSKLKAVAQLRENIYSLDSLLRVVFSVFSVINNGFLVHASGIKFRNAANLFIGKTNAGKSTIAKKFKPSAVLSDELVLVQNINGIIKASSTPFWGELKPGKTNLTLKLKKICFIQKSKKYFVKNEFSPAFIKKLLPNILFFSKDPKLISKMIDTILSMKNKLIFQTLFFPKNISAEKLC